MPQFHAFYVERSGTQSLGVVHYFIGRHEEKFSVFVHELPDEPRAGHAIYFNSFSSNPFHGLSASIICLIVVNSRLTCSAHADNCAGLAEGACRRPRPPLKLDGIGLLDMHVACVTHITENLDGFNPEDIVRKSSEIQIPPPPSPSLAKRAADEEPIFSSDQCLRYNHCQCVFLWYGGTIAAASGKGRGDDSSQKSPRR